MQRLKAVTHEASLRSHSCSRPVACSWLILTATDAYLACQHARWAIPDCALGNMHDLQNCQRPLLSCTDRVKPDAPMSVQATEVQ